MLSPTPPTLAHTGLLKKLRRIPELDALRGFFLVWMTLSHLPTHLSDFVNQPLGFISSAEGFIFLSALLVGRIYIGKVRENSRAIHRKLWKRSLRLYGYQMMLLTLAFTVAAAGAVLMHSTALSNLLDFYMVHPGKAIAASLLLVYCPPLLDILPLYIVLLALSPTILTIAARKSWGPILMVSGAVWLPAQFGLRNWVYSATVGATGAGITLNQTGAFNFFAWQFLWIVAMWIGARSADDKNPLDKIPGYAFPFIAAVCLFFLGVRHEWLGSSLTPESLGMLLDKWQIGSLRALNLAAFLCLVYASRRSLSRLILVQPFPLFGKSSLEVFCAHLVFVFAGLALIAGEATQIHGAAALALVAITFPSLVLLALALSARKKAKADGDRRSAVATFTAQ